MQNIGSLVGDGARSLCDETREYVKERTRDFDDGKRLWTEPLRPRNRPRELHSGWACSLSNTRTSLVRSWKKDRVAAYSGLSNKLAYAFISVRLANLQFCVHTNFQHVQVIRSRFVPHGSRVLNQRLIILAALTVFSPDGHLFQVCFPRLAVLERASHAS